MPKYFLFIILMFISSASFAQSKLDKLTVEKIMRDPKWIGTSPSNIQWTHDGQLFFNWNPDNAPADSLYFITPANRTPRKASIEQQQNLIAINNAIYNKSRTAFIYTKFGDVFHTTVKANKTRRLVQTTDSESNPQFAFNDTKVVYRRGLNLFAWDIATGETIQLSNLVTGKTSKETDLNKQEQWLKNDQLREFEVLRIRKEKRDSTEAYNKRTRPKELRTIYIDDKTVQGLSVSPDGRFISYRLTKPGDSKRIIVPAYVTETGFTTDIPGRTKVGEVLTTAEFFIFDRERDTVFTVKADSTLPGIKDLPDYVKNYPTQLAERTKKASMRNLYFSGPFWSPSGKHAVVQITAGDNKDRWLALWDTATRSLKVLDRQRDNAWIGGPGIFNIGNDNWIDENTFWFQSESTGYSHLYTLHATSGEKKALTNGNYEVQQAQLSNDKKHFYITTNEVHPGEKHFYRFTIANGNVERMTTMTGSNQVSLSPDEKNIANLHSYSNKPWELYLQKNKKNARAEQITFKAQGDEFKSYAWKDPEVITFSARDGATVYGRLFKPTILNANSTKPAVIFVHGAGYLQNAHKWWSTYFREYMFHNLLADNGYHVLDIDYRGSAGYGRDWRTGIYRFMGGKDLDDHVDAAQFLIKQHGVDPKRIGIYGGSYGGFITLMAMFNTPDVFAAGAALRAVTDWAQYNHGYTSNILNEPFSDSIAYRKSSPYYYAQGLKGALLIAHGMVDVNVNYQDAVKLTQRLIELGKDNWELASYPMEDHAFTEPSSWTDEYKRIFKLFERELKK